MLAFAEVALSPGRRGFFFCATVQFLDWVSTLQKWTETGVILWWDRGTRRGKKRCFEFENNEFTCRQDSSIFVQHPSKLSMYHINKDEHAIHFWRSGSSSEELIQGVDYNTFSPFSCDSSWIADIVSRISRPKFNELVSNLDKPAGLIGGTLCSVRSKSLLRRFVM